MFMTYEQVSRKLSQLGVLITPNHVKRLVHEGVLYAVKPPEQIRLGSISPLVVEIEEFERYIKSKGYSAE